MLSRIANNLFWMGRYLERALHTARYVNVHYFSTLDAPLLSHNEYALNSISAMAGLEYEYADKAIDIQENEFLYRILLDDANPVSIKSAIIKARENARGSRDSLSSELWQSINKFYHKVNEYNKKELTHDDVLEFTEMVVDQCLIVEGYMHHTLLHDESWYLIQLGKRIECTAQICRIMIAKVKDLKKAEEANMGKPVETYLCVTLLKSAEAFDMSRIHYRDIPTVRNTLEFIMLNNDFPRSVIFNLNGINRALKRIQLMKFDKKGAPEFFAGKMTAIFSYLTMEEVEDDVLDFLEKTLSDIYRLGELIMVKLS